MNNNNITNNGTINTANFEMELAMLHSTASMLYQVLAQMKTMGDSSSVENFVNKQRSSIVEIEKIIDERTKAFDRQPDTPDTVNFEQKTADMCECIDHIKAKMRDITNVNREVLTTLLFVNNDKKTVDVVYDVNKTIDMRLLRDYPASVLKDFAPSKNIEVLAEGSNHMGICINNATIIEMVFVTEKDCNRTHLRSASEDGYAIHIHLFPSDAFNSSIGN